MAEPNVRVIKIDPFDPITGLLVPFVTQRIIEFARTGMSELDPTQVARCYMARLFNRDDDVLVLAFVDTTGKAVGHAVGTIETDGKNRWVFVSQCRADGNVGDAVKRAMQYADEWAKARGAEFMLMASTRVDTAWKRKYGFDSIRHIMMRSLGAEGKDEE